MWCVRHSALFRIARARSHSDLRQVGKLKARLEHHVSESIQLDQADTSLYLDAEDREAIAVAHAAEQAAEFDPVWEFEWSRNGTSETQAGVSPDTARLLQPGFRKISV
jgi:hypothetical protein